MNASELYALTLSSLTNTLNCMLSTSWTSNVNSESPETQLKAFQAVADVQSAINHLSNAVLASIAEDMVAQQDKLQSATHNLKIATQNLANVQDVLNATATLLNVVGQIIPLV